MATLVLMTGISAVGKSTALTHYIDTVASEDDKPFYYKKTQFGITTKGPQLGIYLAKTHTVVLGGWLSNKDHLFQGADKVISKFDSLSKFVDYVCVLVRGGYNVIVEGASVFITHQLRPLGLESRLTDMRVVHLHYYFEKKEQYVQRCIERSGKAPRTDSMWSKNNINYGTKLNEESMEASKLEYSVYEIKFNARKTFMSEVMEHEGVR